MKKNLHTRAFKWALKAVLYSIVSVAHYACEQETNEPKKENKKQDSSIKSNSTVNKGNNKPPGGGGELYSKSNDIEEENENQKDQIPTHTGKEEDNEEENSVDEEELVEVHEISTDTEDEILPTDQKSDGDDDKEEIRAKENPNQIEQGRFETTKPNKTDKINSPTPMSPDKSPSEFIFPEHSISPTPNIINDYLERKRKSLEQNEMDNDDEDSQSPPNESDNTSVYHHSENEPLLTKSTCSNINNNDNLNREVSTSSSYIDLGDPPSRSQSIEAEQSILYQQNNTRLTSNRFLASTQIEVSHLPPFEEFKSHNSQSTNRFFSIKLKPEYSIDKWKEDSASIFTFEVEEGDNTGNLFVKLGSCPRLLRGREGYYTIAKKNGSKFSTLKKNLDLNNVYDEIYFRYYTTQRMLPISIKIEINIIRKGYDKIETIGLSINPITKDCEILDIK